MADEQEKLEILRLQADAIKGLIEDTEALSNEVNNYQKALGNTATIQIQSAEEAKAAFESIIDTITRKNELDQNDLNTLKNINEMLKQGVSVSGQKVEISKEHNALLQQTNNALKKGVGYQLESLIYAGKKVNVFKTQKELREKIAYLSKEEAGYALAGYLGLEKISNKLISGLKQSVMLVSSIRAEFNKLGVDADSFAKSAIEGAEGIGGVSIQDSVQNQKELLSVYAEFSTISEKQRKELVKTTNVFNNLGLSAKNQAAFLNLSSKAFGMNRSEAKSFFINLEAYARTSKIPLLELDKNLGAIGDKLALLGTSGFEKKFLDLSSSAKKFGIEASRLLDITEQFTTFEQAAQAAGSLNAILGGNFINSIGLVDAAINDQVDLFRQLKTAFDASGKDFESLGLAQKRFVASKLGVSLAEAQKLLNNSLEEGTEAYKNNIKSQEELEKVAAKSADVMKRLEIAFQKIMTSAFVEMIVELAEGFAKLVERTEKSDNAFGGFLGIMLGIGAAILMAFTALSPLVALFLRFVGLSQQRKLIEIASTAAAPTTVASEQAKAAAMGVHTAAINRQTMALNRLAAAQKRAGGAAGAAGPGFAGLGAGLAKFLLILLAVAAAIGIVTASIGFMAQGFAAWNKAQAQRIKAETQQAQVFAKLAETIREMPLLKGNLDIFAEGIEKIANAINKLDLSKMQSLNKLSKLSGIDMNFATVGSAPTIDTKVVPVKVVEVEMKQQEERERADQQIKSGQKPVSNEIKLSINSPVTIDGADFGRLIYNGIAIYEDSTRREQTPDQRLFTTNQLMNWNKFT